MRDPAAAPDPAVSVCICTFNSADRIGLVLESLARQSDATARWDVLVIDNASRDGTGAVVASGLAQQLPGRGRLVREEQPGLMHARRKAAQEATGAYMAFLDDDNIPRPDYVERLLEVLARHPHVGVVGGKVTPEWLGEPTPLGQAVASFALAICDRGDEAFAYPDVTGGPAGAGLVVRRELLRTIFNEASLAHKVTGRTGTALVGGEDTAIVIRAHQLGYACRYEPGLVIAHRIPASRTAPDYLLRLYEGIGRGQASMRSLYDPKARIAALALLIAVKEGLRWLAGALRGPSRSLRAELGTLAPEVHRLHQAQVYGRFRQGLREPFR
jgi:glycosyltransferase involved in cell wall biosynthesis